MGAGASKVQPDSNNSGAEKLQVREGEREREKISSLESEMILLNFLMLFLLQQLNQALVNRLEDPTPIASTEKKMDVSLPRQQYLDSSIQGKIREELSRLRKQEADVRKQIEQALEKENLDRASQSANKGAKGKSSILLQQELDDVKAKIEKHNQRRSKVEKAPGVKQAREKVLQCYK